jgi:hypothetical protein
MTDASNWPWEKAHLQSADSASSLMINIEEFCYKVLEPAIELSNPLNPARPPKPYHPVSIKLNSTQPISQPIDPTLSEAELLSSCARSSPVKNIQLSSRRMQAESRLMSINKHHSKQSCSLYMRLALSPRQSGTQRIDTVKSSVELSRHQDV